MLIVIVVVICVIWVAILLALVFVVFCQCCRGGTSRGGANGNGSSSVLFDVFVIGGTASRGWENGECGDSSYNDGGGGDFSGGDCGGDGGGGCD